MPDTDQVVQILRQHLNSAMNWVKTQVNQLNQQGVMGNDACKKCWTRAIKPALCHASQQAWGACNHLRICATNDQGIRPAQDTVCYQPPTHICNQFGQCGPYPGPGNHQGEWLFDVACLTYQGTWPTQQKVLLAAEVEWGNQNEILKDFAKLLVTRAEVRVMVYHQCFIGFDQLAQYIHHCQDTQCGDTYLLAEFGDAPDTPRIVYYRIDARQPQAIQQLVPIQGDWFPGFGPPQP